jgi:hypothetical protein
MSNQRVNYPYPIKNWTQPELYPKSEDLSLNEWAWEFLRRNPEYQRLYDKFAALPDFMVLEDGTTTVKNGKWKGTPWLGMRFFQDGACFYADPEPIPGESNEEYYQRTGGEIMPFADYFARRFKLSPYVNDPRGDDWIIYSDPASDSEMIPPWQINVEPPDPLIKAYQQEGWESSLQEHGGRERLVLSFDVRYPIDDQIDRAKAWLKDLRKELEQDPESGFQPITFASNKLDKYPSYILMLDAEASLVGEGKASTDIYDEIARALFPYDENSYKTGYRPRKRVNKALQAARRLRDETYMDMLTRDV